MNMQIVITANTAEELRDEVVTLLRHLAAMKESASGISQGRARLSFQASQAALLEAASLLDDCLIEERKTK